MMTIGETLRWVELLQHLKRVSVFGSWFLTALMTCVVYAILLGTGQLVSAYLALDWFAKVASYGELGTILVVFTAGIANGFFYGCITYLITKEGL